jgi:cell division septum initiation protein DivIVA
MLEASLNQIEQLVSDLMQKNAQLTEQNTALGQELAQAKEENETLQLSLMEQEEKHGATAARIQALVDRASAGVVAHETAPQPVNVVSILGNDYSIKAPEGQEETLAQAVRMLNTALAETKRSTRPDR